MAKKRGRQWPARKMAKPLILQTKKTLPKKPANGKRLLAWTAGHLARVEQVIDAPFSLLEERKNPAILSPVAAQGL